MLFVEVSYLYLSILISVSDNNMPRGYRLYHYILNTGAIIPTYTSVNGDLFFYPQAVTSTRYRPFIYCCQ